MKYIKIHIMHLASIFFVVSIIALLYNPYSQFIYGGDAGSYLEVSENFLSVSAASRPPIYPIIIFIGDKILKIDWKYFIVFCNWMFYLGISYLLWKLFSYFNFYNSIKWFIILLVLLSPRILYYKYDLSPELLFSYLILLLFYSICKIIDKPHRFKLSSAIGIGFISALCTLTKPIWLLGILPVMLFLFIFNKSKNNLQFKWKLIFIIISVNLFTLLPWHYLLYINFNQKNISNIQTRNLNLNSIRAGYYKDTEGTELYNFISKNENLHDMINDINWKEFDKFSQIKNELNKIDDNLLSEDSQFYTSAISKNIFSYLLIQLSRIPAFINSKFLNLLFWNQWPNEIELFYLRFYKFIYLFFIPLAFISGISISLFRRDPINILATIFILYFTFVCVFVSYQNSTFTRFRVGIDPILIPYFFICFRNINLFIYNK